MCCHGLASAGNKEPRSCCLTPPPPQWDGDENQKEKAKLVGWDEDSLKEWQSEKTITINNTDKKNIQRAMFSPPNA